MPIPKYDEIQVPAMKLLRKEKSLRLKDFVTPLADHFRLTDEEVMKMYPSGNGHIFYDRISWALSHLNLAGLLEKPKRGTYAINQQGIDILNRPGEIKQYIEKKLEERRQTKQEEQTTEDKILAHQDTSDLTPQEKLYASFENIRTSIYTEILNTILNKAPVEFEKLVVLLLQRMGYGGEIKDSGLVTKASNDGGIDGIIKEDVLGLGRIHIQAKRYRLDTTISREEIQKFVGALAVAQSNKGVFITTSRYSRGAIEYAENLNGATTVALVDGEKLAEFIYNSGLGMQIEQTIEIKRLDAEFWDSMKDDS